MGKSKKRARSPSRAADDGARGGEPAAAVAAAAAGPAETVAPPAKTGRKHARKNRETSPAAEPAAAPAQAAAEPAAPPAKTSRKHARKNREPSPTAEPAAAPAPAAAEPAAAIARRRQKSEPRGKTKAVDQARAKKRVLARDDDDDGDDGAGAVAEDEDTSAREIAAEAKNGAEETEEQNDEGRMLRLHPEPAGSSNGAPAKHGQKGKVKSKTEARQGADESEAGLETGPRGSQEAASRGSEVENDIRRKTVARNRPAGKNDGASRKRNADKGGTQDADEKSKQVRQDSAHAAAAEISRSGKRHKSMDTGKESERLPDFVASKKEGASAGSPAQEGEGIEKPDDSDAGATKGSKSKKRKDVSFMSFVWIFFRMVFASPPDSTVCASMIDFYVELSHLFWPTPADHCWFHNAWKGE
ncbi:MAG: hypothetical protein BJ554DRAFT_3923 [Olpidium bornovanus]|uniref:Uncharacterized protein n=1 Tax=Olpidium bornovanus TaxID=278681 RepID=A0A8H7ZN29_9FUNG|nr:MAG: hypothetical protein BJ554DRAFT_3923 [Olpidium bornovanus]